MTHYRTCTWNDQDCHAIWVAQRNIQVNGYIRRSCNSNRSGESPLSISRLSLSYILPIINIECDAEYFSFIGTNVPNSAARSDGYYTVGMQDYSFQVPDNRIIGCAAGCGDTQYPDPIPGSDPVTPITV